MAECLRCKVLKELKEIIENFDYRAGYPTSNRLFHVRHKLLCDKIINECLTKEESKK